MKMFVPQFLIILFVSTSLLASPNDLSLHNQRECSRRFEQALNEYDTENYWDAHLMLRDLSRLYTTPSVQKDSIDLYTLRSLSKMEMRESVTEMCEVLFEQEISTLLPEVRLILLRQMYLDGDLYTVEDLFNNIQEEWRLGSCGDSVYEEALYYYGQSLYEVDLFDSAMTHLLQIPSSSNMYSFAQHTIGVIYSHYDHYDNSYIHHLIVVELLPSSRNESEIINASRFQLGVISYEAMRSTGGSYSEADHHLRQIPSESIFYQKALVVRMWCALYLQDWEYLILLCNELHSITDNPLFIADANLLRSITIVGEVDSDIGFDQRIELLEKGSVLVEEFAPVSEDSLRLLKDSYYGVRHTYYGLSQRVIELSLLGNQENYSNELDSLKNVYLETLPMIWYISHNSFTYQFDLYMDGRYILDDIRYVLAGFRPIFYDKRDQYRDSEGAILIEDEIFRRKLDFLKPGTLSI